MRKSANMSTALVVTVQRVVLGFTTSMLLTLPLQTYLRSVIVVMDFSLLNSSDTECICKSTSGKGTIRMGFGRRTEAFVFVKEEPLPLRYWPCPEERLIMRSHADPNHPDHVFYHEGEDFVVDYGTGLIRRTKESRIRDWSRHALYGVSDFDHTQYGDYSNREYTVYAEYSCASEEGAPQSWNESESRGFWNRIIDKLQSGAEVDYVVYGDSISLGGEASADKFTYFHRFAEKMSSGHARGSFRIFNRSIGGETSAGGAQRIKKDVMPLRPDLLSIGYGMNDQNKSGDGNAVSLTQFESNLRYMIEAVRENSDSEIVLVTPCEPNPLWRYTSGQIGEYANAIRFLGQEYGLFVADVHEVWERELAAGKTPESLLLNNINHPNDYGHFLYYQAFVSMLANAGRIH